MPFEQTIPRTFTPEGVVTYAPEASGVYGISNARQWLYIGHTGNIQHALLDLLGQPHNSVMKKQPRGFVFEVCDEGRCIVRQNRLVQEYEPVCNRPSSGPR